MAGGDAIIWTNDDSVQRRIYAAQGELCHWLDIIAIISMMTSSNGNIFHAAGPLWG